MTLKAEFQTMAQRMDAATVERELDRVGRFPASLDEVEVTRIAAKVGTSPEMVRDVFDGIRIYAECLRERMRQQLQEFLTELTRGKGGD